MNKKDWLTSVPKRKEGVESLSLNRIAVLLVSVRVVNHGHSKIALCVVSSVYNKLKKRS